MVEVNHHDDKVDFGPVIITMIKWIRTSRLSIKNSRSEVNPKHTGEQPSQGGHGKYVTVAAHKGFAGPSSPTVNPVPFASRLPFRI